MLELVFRMNVTMLRHLLLLLFILGVTSKAEAEEVCFDDVGCFDDVTCHEIGFPPKSPQYINTRFFLYTRNNMNAEQELIAGDVEGLRASNFDPKRRTKLSVHGWFSSGFSGGELNTKNAFLEVEDVNVIIVDWRRGAAFGRYGIAHQNTRVVGREIGLLLRFLNLETGMYYRDVHMVGMSLGAHAIGYAGEFQPGVGRITGLDPAGPLFREEGVRRNGPQCRLDPTDALFVDVIHTDANDITGLGQMLQLGHQDFYPNGGRRQPGCTGIDLSGCSHTRAPRLFTESIRLQLQTCSFTAYPCESWADYQTGRCGDCGVDGCAFMGFHADKNMAATGKFYLETTGEAPYCI